jgi:hypothetical protein
VRSAPDLRARLWPRRSAPPLFLLLPIPRPTRSLDRLALKCAGGHNGGADRALNGWLDTEERHFLYPFAILLLLSGASLGQCTSSSSLSSNRITYSFEPIVTTNGMAMHVILQFKGGPSGMVKLKLPSEWAGQKHAEDAIAELTPLSGETTLSVTQSPATKELHFTPGTPIRISYVLVKDWKGPLDSSTRFRPDLSRDYFHIIGKTSLVHPALDPSSVVDVQFDWHNLPLEWSLATSFGTDDTPTGGKSTNDLCDQKQLTGQAGQFISVICKKELVVLTFHVFNGS